MRGFAFRSRRLDSRKWKLKTQSATPSVRPPTAQESDADGNNERDSDNVPVVDPLIRWLSRSVGVGLAWAL